MDTNATKRFPLGKDGPLIPRIGLGCMGMSAYYGCRPSEEESLKVTFTPVFLVNSLVSY